MNMKSLKDKVIIVTGASSGIGEAMARLYAAHGAKVVLCARSEDTVSYTHLTLPTSDLV